MGFIYLSDIFISGKLSLHHRNCELGRPYQIMSFCALYTQTNSGQKVAPTLSLIFTRVSYFNFKFLKPHCLSFNFYLLLILNVILSFNMIHFYSITFRLYSEKFFLLLVVSLHLREIHFIPEEQNIKKMIP